MFTADHDQCFYSMQINSIWDVREELACNEFTTAYNKIIRKICLLILVSCFICCVYKGTLFLLFFSGLRNNVLRFFYAYGILALVSMVAVSYGLSTYIVLFIGILAIYGRIQATTSLIGWLRDRPSDVRAFYSCFLVTT